MSKAVNVRAIRCSLVSFQVSPGPQQLGLGPCQHTRVLGSGLGFSGTKSAQQNMISGSNDGLQYTVCKCALYCSWLDEEEQSPRSPVAPRHPHSKPETTKPQKAGPLNFLESPNAHKVNIWGHRRSSWKIND